MADQSPFDAVIRDLNARMLASVTGQMMTLAPPPLTCPACGTTRDACLRLFGRDRYHDEQIRAALRNPGL